MITWKQALPGYDWLIHQVWFLEVEQGEPIDPKPYLIPNPRAHLLITPEQQNYGYHASDMVLSGQGSHLLTITDKLLLLEDTAPLKRIGITFKPHALYSLNKGAPLELNQSGWFAWLDELFPTSFQTALLEHSSREEITMRIKRQFDSSEIFPSTDKPFTLAGNVVNLVETSQMHNIDDLAQECACSRRTLERAFKQAVGLSLKTYLQMMRLEQMVLELHGVVGDVNWADFSQQYGFSDQSHLIRTLKQLLNKTPSGYLKHRDLTIDIYGDFD